MLKDLTWSFFEKTGNVETFLEYSKLTAAQKCSGKPAANSAMPKGVPWQVGVGNDGQNTGFNN